MSGKAANDSGASLTRLVAKMLRDKGLDFLNEHFINCVCPLQKEIRVDFYVLPSQVWSLYDGFYIECKNQTSGGTAEEKIVYLHEKIKHTYDRKTVVVVDGNEESDRAYFFLSQRVGGMLLNVCRAVEFEEWLQHLAVQRLQGRLFGNVRAFQ